MSPGLRPREPQGERRPLAFARVDRHRAAVVGRDVADDGEPQAGAPGAPVTCPVDPVEALEDPVEVLGRDPDPLVANRDLGPLVAAQHSTTTLVPESEYFTALSSRLATADTSWSSSAFTEAPGAHRSTSTRT